MGINTTNTGQGARDSRAIQIGSAKHPKSDAVWFPVVGDWFDEDSMQAAHLSPCMHGQEVMDTIFGKKNPPEPFSPRNGLLVSREIEKYFDSGKFVIVSDLPDRPPLAELISWVQAECRDYRVRIIDPKWEKLNHAVSIHYNITWRALDVKKLQFRIKF
ncbi:HNH endonuclease signature motif containing protein [Aspergillus puulaauensis]|uniref:HNH nuclease domain-containing protein n=1 Tax=Aspergillus puulaauensis TaxID=1220207 RepID=A0A7R7XRT4_9EURO|nr:uncharacterized protein APUU_50419S [Aspergillus puulaauensis]BCS25708.1 hypothetical protein APUU_50419S [Aspergillus puulaauensis]